MGSKADEKVDQEVGDETDDETDDETGEQPDTTDLPGLETEDEAEKRQKGQGLKILTRQQMITRLPILSAQLQAGNNSRKLKNEIRKIVYSLYRSKNLSKTIYNSLINTI